MRIGLNPHKDKEHKADDYFHQIVIPVYIPNFEGYFEDSFQVLEHCLQSLFTTVHQKTYITVVNNGSCEEIKKYLNELFEQNKIHEIIHSTNIGKLNAVLKGITGHNFPFVTITDSDVLFCSGWQAETYKIYETFPKTGVVGLTPQFKTFVANCSNVIFENLFSKKLKFTKVINPKALEQFYESIGWDNNYNHDYLKYNLAIETDNCTALLGTGHFAATYKREIFDEIVTYIGAKMGAGSEHYLDIAPLKKGLWRLCTADNFAYHIGNVTEDWMQEKINNNYQSSIINHQSSIINHQNISPLEYFIKNRLFAKVFSNETVKKLLYRYKGLPKEMIKKY